MGELHFTKDHKPISEIEAKGWQFLADGVNAIGYVNRKRLKRKEWHRVTMWVRWVGRRELEVADLTIVEDRNYAAE